MHIVPRLTPTLPPPANLLDSTRGDPMPQPAERHLIETRICPHCDGLRDAIQPCGCGLP